MPNAYKGHQYGPVEVFINDDYKNVNFSDIDLPEGLKITKDGCITGIPANSGEFTFEIHFKKWYERSV